MPVKQPASADLRLSANVDSPLRLVHDSITVAATAILQHRRDRDTRYAWTVGAGVSPPLDLVNTEPQTPAGTLTVSGSAELTLTVPSGTLTPGRWLYQVAVRVDGGPRHVTPADPRYIQLTENER